MNASTQPVELNTAMLEALSRVTPGSRGPLSPLAPHEYSFEVDEPIRQLVDKGFLNLSGEPQDWFLPLLETLLNPTRVIELDASTGQDISLAIFLREDSPVVTLRQLEGQRLQLAAPDQPEECMQILRTLPAPADAAFSANLNLSESRLLGALIDIQRQTALVSAIRGRQQTAEILPVQSRVSSLQRALKDSQANLLSLAWSASACLNSLLSATTESDPSLERDLQNLATTRLISFDRGEYRLDPLVASWANHLLLPQAGLSLTLRQQNLEGKVQIESLISLLSPDTHFTIMARGGGVVSFNPLNPSSLPEISIRLLRGEGSLYDLTGLGNLLTDVAVFF